MTPVSGRRALRIATLLLVSALGTAAAAAAQGEASAVVTGVIADAQGGVLPGVTVTLRNVESGTVRTAVTEADGQYRLAGLQPGQVQLESRAGGFATAEVTNLALTIGLSVQQNLTMALQGHTGSVDRDCAGARRGNDHRPKWRAW